MNPNACLFLAQPDVRSTAHDMAHISNYTPATSIEQGLPIDLDISFPYGTYDWKQPLSFTNAPQPEPTTSEKS